MNAVVRGDVNRIRIGRRSNIQDGTIVHVMHGTHPTTIGDEVTIGHAAVIHGCTLRDRVLVGMGAILLNGVDVGEDSIVAAGSLVPENAAVPPRSLVMGSPGKVRRTLSDEEVGASAGMPIVTSSIASTTWPDADGRAHTTGARDAGLPAGRRPEA